MAYDRLGRPRTLADASGSRTLAYHASGQLDMESYTSGGLNGSVIDRDYDPMARLESTAALSGASVLNQIGYSYDAASRLETVTSGTNTASYVYHANSPLVHTVTFMQGGSARLTTTKNYDYLNRLSSITNTPSSGPVGPSFSYDYNSANQRTKTTRENNAYWSYSYDPLGQVTSGKKFNASAAVIPGHDFSWTYDDIGNRKTATANGQTSTYTPDASLLNQYAQRTVPAAVDVLGAATAASTVTLSVDSGPTQATTREGELFYKQLTQPNDSMSEIKVTGVKNLAGAGGEDAVATITRDSYVPATPESFGHDADGNVSVRPRTS